MLQGYDTIVSNKKSQKLKPRQNICNLNTFFSTIVLIFIVQYIEDCNCDSYNIEHKKSKNGKKIKGLFLQV